MYFANRSQLASFGLIRADSKQVFKFSLSKMSSHQNQPAYKATSLLNYYEYSKIKKAEPIVAKTNKRKKIVANAFYADKLHSASEHVTTAKKPKIAETVTSGTICNYYATEKNTDIAPAVTAASEYAQVATAATASHKIAATEASASESNFEISIIEVAEENITSDGDSEIENCVNVNCKTKVLS